MTKYHRPTKVPMSCDEFSKSSDYQANNGHGFWICIDGVLKCNCYDSKPVALKTKRKRNNHGCLDRFKRWFSACKKDKI